MPFILLTETWLREHLDAELNIENYTLFRCDRNRKKKARGRNSGGVAIYLSSALPADVLFEYSSGVIEAICLKVELLNLILCVVYRQPDDIVGGHRSTSEQFSKFIEKLSNEMNALPAPTPNIIIGGDFNLPHALWPSGEHTQGAGPDERRMIDLIVEFSTQHFLTQISDEATHQAGNVLDLIFTNCTNNLISSESIPVAPISSHHLVKFSTLIQADPSVSFGIKEHDNPFDKVNLFSDEVNWLRGKDQPFWARGFAAERLQVSEWFIVEKCTL